MATSQKQSGEFARLRQVWNARARANAFEAVHTGRGLWKGPVTVEEFFDSGTREVDLILGYLSRLGIPVRRGKALDFGCGVGRLSRALALHFETVVGVDISDEMVLRANELNRDLSNARFAVNASDDLRVFESESFDFVLSDIVLQHVPVTQSRRYLSEFVRLLAVDGIAVFQLPGSVTRRRIATRVAARRGYANSGIDPAEVEQIVRSAGGIIRESLSSPGSYRSLIHILPGGPDPGTDTLGGTVYGLLVDKRPSFAYVVQRQAHRPP